MAPPRRTYSRRMFLHTALAGATAAGFACAGSDAGDPPDGAVSISTATPAPPAATVVPTLTRIPASLEEKLGQMLLVGFTGTRFGASTYFADSLASGKVGNVVLFGDNVQSPAQIAELTGRMQQVAP